eukprot:g45755.t1
MTARQNFNMFTGDELEVLFVTRNTDSTTVFPEKRKQQKRHRRVKNSCLWCSSFIPVMTGITMAAIIRGRSDIHAVTRLIQRDHDWYRNGGVIDGGGKTKIFISSGAADRGSELSNGLVTYGYLDVKADNINKFSVLNQI